MCLTTIYMDKLYNNLLIGQAYICTVCIARNHVHTVQMHAGPIRKLYSLYMYILTGDNPLAKARGLSSRTDNQTIQ